MAYVDHYLSFADETEAQNALAGIEVQFPLKTRKTKTLTLSRLWGANVHPVSPVTARAVYGPANDPKDPRARTLITPEQKLDNLYWVRVSLHEGSSAEAELQALPGYQFTKERSTGELSKRAQTRTLADLNTVIAFDGAAFLDGQTEKQIDYGRLKDKVVPPVDDTAEAALKP